MRARAEGAEARSAMIQEGFGKDGSGGISGTKKQQGSPTQPGGQSHQVVSFELCRGFLTSID